MRAARAGTAGLVLLSALAVLVEHPAAQPAVQAARVGINENRAGAGRLTDGVLTVRLDVRTAWWFPDGDDRPGLEVKAFAGEGTPPQVPGPLIRVPAGTNVRALVSNRLGREPIVLHGMYSRAATAADEPIVIPPGDARDVHFRLEQPGTYFYWAASTADATIQTRSPADTQLSGAIVVDPPGSSVPDRILVIGYWHNGVAVGAGGVAHERYRYVINGRSWPATERLSFGVGETVRMRLINAGANVHPMHLHGFYFDVVSRGDEWVDVAAAPTASPRLVVTERLAQGRTFALQWTPTRPGNWLFHCHDNVHLDHGGALPGSAAVRAAGPDHDHLSMMAGPVMGIRVTGRSAEAPGAGQTRRSLQLTARVDTGGTPEEPAYGYTLDSAPGVAPRPPYLPGPTILLKRGEPVSITVRNELPVPTAVHWHGIELESYYDGVAGFAGDGARVAPAIAPGGTFEARFTPPRSGTFIYHTHLDDTRQQQAGLSGPLLVVDDPAAYDPDRDLVFLITVPRKAADAGTALVNGSAHPARRELRAGQHYRLRFINAHTFRPSMRMRVLRDAELLRWRGLAKDGMDLPVDQAIEGPSEVQMGNGETYDFDFVPDHPGELRLDVTTGGGVLLATVPILVAGD